MTLVLIEGLFFVSVGLLGSILSQEMAEKGRSYLQQQANRVSDQLQIMFVDVPRKKLILMFGVSPLAGMFVGYFLLPDAPMVGLGCGLIGGLMLPQLVTRVIGMRRQQLFRRQLVDTLMVLSSSLKAGLSIIQAIEVVVEEVPSPASQEFGLVLKETKMGVSLNEALARLKQRMTSEDLTLIITAIVVSRETGGDVTNVFSKLIETIRERQKFKERVTTLTVIPRVQAMIMAVLPIAFAIFSSKMSPGYFDTLFHDPVGRILIMTAVGMWCVSVVLMIFFGRIRV